VTSFHAPLAVKAGKAGARIATRSQDISLEVLVGSGSSGHFSDKEKDEASPLNCFPRGSSNAFILRFAGA